MIESEVNEEEATAMQMQLLLSELRPRIELSYNAMTLTGFLSMYCTYLYSGLFTETHDAKDKDLPMFIDPKKLKHKNIDSPTLDFK